jgi:hypothetical protein
MKRFLILAIIAVTLIACNKDDEFVPKTEISKKSLQFQYSGGVDSFAITSNTDWTVEKDAADDWIALSKTSGNGNAVIKVTVTDENLAKEPLKAKITVKTAGSSDIFTIDVTQESPEPNREVDKQSLQFTYSVSTDSFAIASNVSWTIEKGDADWITLSEASGNGNAVIKVTVAENTVPTPRSATITVKAAGFDDIGIAVTQSKALETVGLYILSEGTWGRGEANILYYDVKTGELSGKFSEVNGKPLGDGANDLAIYGSKLYCVVTGSSGEPSETDGYIEVINPETGTSLTRIPIEEGNGDNSRPRRIMFHGSKAYVTTYSQSVIRIDTASLAIDGRATLSGTFAEGITRYNDNLYICNSGQGRDNTISVVNISSFTETATISVPKNPVMIETASSGDIYFTTSTVYDENWAVSASSNIHILDPVQKQVSHTFNFNALSIALTKDFIYTADYLSAYEDQINKINLQTREVSNITDIYEDYMMAYSISANPLTGDIYLGNMGQDVVAFDKDGKEKFSFKTKIAYTLKVVPVIK